MKSLLSVFALSVIFSDCLATDYYSQGSVCPNALSNWNVNPQGGGAAATSFNDPGDRFIIQSGHTMITTATWTIGAAGSVLQIQNGGTLKADHSVLLAGTFQIDDGGTYIHNNTGSVDEAAGNSIFSGAELFAADSHFEIRLWPGKDVGLPNASPGISWGDLIINLQSDISADGMPWNWGIGDGATLTIKGDLDIRATYVSNASELRFTSSGIQIVNVDGNFLMSGSKTKVSIKSSASQLVDGYTTMQVNGNIILTGLSQLELGVNTTFPNPHELYELRFKGNFQSNSGAGVLFTSSRQAYLTANGTSSQSLYHLWNFGSNFRVAPGALVNLMSSLTFYGSDQVLAISGTFNQDGYDISTNGSIECAGGVFNSEGYLYIGNNCTACSNLNGTYNNSSNTWCTASGTKGKINFTNSTVYLENWLSPNLFTAGNPVINSPGDIYFVNSIASSLSSIPIAAIFGVQENSIFSLDVNSYINGDQASYQSNGGLLRIGSTDGITATGNTAKGNIRTGLNKDYNLSGVNSFEYFGTSSQVAGNGLPTTIDGTLKINNTAGAGTSGVTLSQPTIVKGILDLTSGKLTTSLSSLITLDKNSSVNLPVWGASYVAGPIKKIGSISFTFPIGKGNNFAPLTLTGIGYSTDEYVAEYFMADPGIVIGSSFDNPPIQELSTLEWWTVDRSAGSTAKSVTLEATTYTNAILLSNLRVMRWDGTTWKNEGNTGYSGISSGQVTSNLVNDFFAAGTSTPFTFGSVTPGSDPLSLTLLSFGASKLTTTKASLIWELSTYCPVTSKFEIEKAYADRRFSKIGVINGNETSRFYSYIDNGLKSGINYYRLKMTDENGKVAYSKIAIVMNNANGLFFTSLAPTLTSNITNLNIVSSKPQRFDLVIVDMQGRIIQKQNYGISAGNMSIQLVTDRLAAGMYQVFGVTDDGKTNVISFVRR